MNSLAQTLMLSVVQGIPSGWSGDEVLELQYDLTLFE